MTNSHIAFHIYIYIYIYIYTYIYIYCMFAGSVFDVLATQKMEPPNLPPTQISFTLGSSPAQVKTETPNVTGQSPVSRPHQPLDTVSPATTPASSTSADFQPFARAPEKQARYDTFLELRKQGKAGEYKVKASSYIAQYPVLRTVQSALHFTSLTDLFTHTPS